MTVRRDIRLVLADVDGTLVTPDKVLSEAAQAAVRDLRKAGIAFAITSGRPPRGMSMLIAPLDLRVAIAGFNGGEFVNPDLSLIESHTLEPAVASEALKLILEQGLDAWVYTEKQWLLRDSQAPHVAREAWTMKFEPQIVALFTPEHLAHAVGSALGDRASVARTQPYYLDVTHPLANKGEVVTKLSELLNIAPAEIATIGDMPNDVRMFARSGFSIAMGNARDDVKAQASVVTDSNENDGFAQAMQKFVLAGKDK